MNQKSSKWKPKHLGNYQFSKNNNDDIHATDYMATIATVYETGTEIDHVKWHHNRPLTQPPSNYGNHTGQILIVRHKIVSWSNHDGHHDSWLMIVITI